MKSTSDSERQNRQNRQRLFEVLREVALLPAEQRTTRLASEPPDLAQLVLQMLQESEPDDGFLATDAMGLQLSAAEDSGPEIEPMSRVGPYRVVKLLGEGGMGTVFLAEQQEPVRRKVALKLLRVHLVTPGARLRFEDEQRAMERLAHPNVGRILDAGATDDGRPFLAMEFIRGEPVTTYCDRHRLSVEDRLRLFVDICRGVEHAHRRLLLHRDIKPSNVLVAEIDGHPVPKLIDFGIAKLLDASKASEATGHLLGTPAYMSPEALDQSPKLDTRTDVFSLGVMLHQLLLGRLPWEADGSSVTSLLDNRSRGNATRPSTTFRGFDEVERQELAALRDVSVRELSQRLRVDLDWIVLKCLALDPADRYGSAADLAEDLERHLEGEPITARPHGTRYLVRKAYQRHRTALVAAALAAVSLHVGIAGMSLGWLRARDAEHRALEQAAEAAASRDEAEEVVRFLTDVFHHAGPDTGSEAESVDAMTALELVERAAEDVSENLRDRPRVRARVEAAIGNVFGQLAEYDRSLELLDRAVSTLEQVEPATSTLLARTLTRQAEVHIRLSNYDEALAIFGKAKVRLGQAERRPERTILAEIESGLGRIYGRLGEYESARSHLERALTIHTELHGEDSLRAAVDTTNLGAAYFRQERWSEAAPLFRRAMEIYESHYPQGHARVNVTRMNLASTLASQGKNVEALPLLEAVLEAQTALLGDDHPRVGDVLNNLGVTTHDLGRLEQAAEYHRRALALRETALGPDHPRTAWSLENLARVFQDLGQLDEAERLERRALAIRQRVYDDSDHLEIARSYSHLADLARLEGDLASAADLKRNALRIETLKLPPDSSRLANTEVDLGILLWLRGHEAEAKELVAKGLARFSGDDQERKQEALAQVRDAGIEIEDSPDSLMETDPQQ